MIAYNAKARLRGAAARAVRHAAAIATAVGVASLATALVPCSRVGVLFAQARGSGASNASQPVATTAPTANGSRQGKLTAGLLFERVSFADGGILESDLAGGDSTRVVSASGLAVPLQYSTVLGGVWLVDAGTSFTSGERKIAGSDSASRLTGLGDIRVRVSRRFDRLGLRITAGANLPTGITGLDNGQTATLSVLGSPAIGTTQPAVGFGVGGTVGVVKSFASASRQWGVAVGASVEWRGEYEPYAALAAGSPLDGYDPGEVVRVSAGASRLFGGSKGLITASLDLFAADKVLPHGGATPLEVQIGPTVSLDGQWQPATTRIKSAVLFAGVRLRSALKRDGTELENSGNTVFEIGGRGARAMTGNTDVVFELSGRVLTAIEIDNRLATAASTSVAPAIGFSYSGAAWTLTPMATARIGNVDTGLQSGGFTVLGARIMLERRF